MSAKIYQFLTNETACGWPALTFYARLYGVDISDATRLDVKLILKDILEAIERGW